MTLRNLCALLILCLPALAQAQAYKCRQADGSQSFQDRPCASGEVATALTLPPPSAHPPANGTGASPPARAATRRSLGWEPTAPGVTPDPERQRLNAEMAAQVQQLNAQNRLVRCNFARRQLGVLREHRPVFARDNAGTRQYIGDDRRAAEITNWEQAVAKECG